jgi:predicted nucleic acid-binding protein
LPGGPAAVLELLSRQLVKAPFRLEQESSRVGALVQRYADIPMSLADACLVRMAELTRGAVVWTLDNDFRVYRMYRNRELPVDMPEETR